MEESNLELENDANRLERFINEKSEIESISDDDSSDSEGDFFIDEDNSEFNGRFRFLSRREELEDESEWNTEPSIENCYQINIKYQIVLEEAIRDLEFELSKNRELQFLIQDELLKNQNKPKDKFSWNIFCKPYFRDRCGLAPPSNEDVKKKADNDEWPVDTTMPSTWSTKEETTLIKAVKTNAIEKELQPKQANCEVLAMELQTCELGAKEVKRKKKELAKAENELEELKNATTDLSLSRNIEYDWMKISVLDFDGRRSPVEIELYWKNYLRPDVNKSKWKKDELEKLKNIIKEKPLIDWDDIAHDVGSGRTALQCCSKYHSKLQPGHKKFWSNEEKAKIVELVEKYRIGDYIQWNKITEEMEGRTIKQIWHQYNYIITPLKKKGVWTEEEDMCLLAGVWLFGVKSFWKICKYVEKRNSKQCRERWHFALNPELRFSTWTKAEDEKLLQLVEKHGKTWCAFREHFNGRTGPMLRRRYNRMAMTGEIRSRVDYKVKYGDYQGYIYRRVYMCLKNFCRGYKVQRPTTFLAFKKSIFEPGSDDVFASLRRVVLQLPLQTFHKMLGPGGWATKTRKSGSVEHQLKTYLSLFNFPSTVGRPAKSFKINENVEEYQKHLSGLTNVLSVFDRLDGVRPMVLLPPMVKTLSVFRSLLLLKNHLLYLQVNTEDEDMEGNENQLEAVTSSESYQLLFQQFVSLFFWPAILSAVKIQEPTRDRLTYANVNKDPQTSENADVGKVEKGLNNRGRKIKKSKMLRAKKKTETTTENTTESSLETTPKIRKRKRKRVQPPPCSNPRKSCRLIEKNNTILIP